MKPGDIPGFSYTVALRLNRLNIRYTAGVLYREGKADIPR